VAIDNMLSLEITFITPVHLKARLDAGEYLCLIDARERHAFGMAHIPGAQWCRLTCWLRRLSVSLLPHMYHWCSIVAVVRLLRCL
jgi:rhodanese-related sulfurtransferase